MSVTVWRWTSDTRHSPTASLMTRCRPSSGVSTAISHLWGDTLTHLLNPVVRVNTKSYSDYSGSSFDNDPDRLPVQIDLEISATHHLLWLYVILQYHFRVESIQELVECRSWDFLKWSVGISSIRPDHRLPDYLILLKCFLNLQDRYNTVLTIDSLEKEHQIRLSDKRGLGGERPREIYYKFGFPFLTPATQKSLRNGQRIFVHPFPTKRINPHRRAKIPSGKTDTKQCFLCRRQEGDDNPLGTPTALEKGHLIPIMVDREEVVSIWQCRWCNTFFKDKIIWDSHTLKPAFHEYAIIRDMKKPKLIAILKTLGFVPEDLR